MNYTSTRNSEISASCSEVISKGISDDGGLFVPTELPRYSISDIGKLINSNYIFIAKTLLAPFLSDFSHSEIEQSLNCAYSSKKFGSCCPAPLRSNFTDFKNLSILELFHGPTLAFKDIALQLLPELLTKSIHKKYPNKSALIMVATSGDTGKAALEGFKNVDNMKLIVFYPKDGVSNIQKLQMQTQEGNNLNVCAVDGNFDDAQTQVKNIFTDAYARKVLVDHNLIFSSANSINWGRLLPQIVYYFSAYLDLLNSNTISLGDKINFVVPTGNFGNILAGFYAKEMGLPINKLICASNANNVLTEFINTGTYNKNRDFHLTISPSMDILVSSNLERLLYHLSGSNTALVSKYMSELKSCGKYTVDEKIYNQIKGHFFAESCTDKETKETIKMFFESENYLLDPHSAVALNVYLKYLRETNDNTHTVLLSTASAYKFPVDVLSSIDNKSKPQNEFEALNLLSSKTQTAIPRQISELLSKKINFQNECQKDNMINSVLKFIERKK